MSLRLVVWDLDGTIIDSRIVIQNAMEAAFHSFGLAPPEYDQTRQIVGLSLEEACRRLAPEGFPEADVPKLSEAYKNAFITHRTNNPDFREPLYDGATEILEALANQNCLMGIATGKSRRGIEAIFGKHDLSRYFDTIWCADDGPGKPAPDLLLDAMAECDVTAAQTVMIGDTSFDMIMAKAANAYAIGVGWGYQSVEEVVEAGADAVAEQPEKLVELLKNLPAHG